MCNIATCAKIFASRRNEMNKSLLAVSGFVMIVLLKSMPVFAEPVVIDEVLIPKAPDQAMEVRHIVIKGTNQEIGKALGDIAQEWLDVKLSKFAGPLYAEANHLYVEKNYPILWERMKGVAQSYGLAPENKVYNTSGLPYDIGPFACSVLYIPPEFSADGHAILGHNFDFHIALMSDILGIPPIQGAQPLYSRTCVVELYPDKGYPSIVVGSLDLLNSLQGGMNSKGLVVNILTDTSRKPYLSGSGGDGKNGGLNGIQLMRLLLDTCSNVNEAKVALTINKLAPVFDSFHFIISDRSGKSFVYEISGEDGSSHFTDNNGKPMILTNHAVFLYPDPQKFPAWDAKDTYNTFRRYKLIWDFVQHHQGKFAPNDVNTVLAKVYANIQGGPQFSPGAQKATPGRTLFHNVFDPEALTLNTKFYLKDGPTDGATGYPSLVFSKIFQFKLEETK